MERQSYKNYIINKYGDIVFKTLKEFQTATKTTEILNKDIDFFVAMQTLENHSYTLQNRRKKIGFTNDEKDDRGDRKKIVKPLNCQKLFETVETAKNQRE